MPRMAAYRVIRGATVGTVVSALIAGFVLLVVGLLRQESVLVLVGAALLGVSVVGAIVTPSTKTKPQE